MERILSGWEAVRRSWRDAAPYLIVELVLPGGSLFALMLYLYRRRALALVSGKA